MCLGLPGQIIALSQEHLDLASVDIAGVERPVNLGLLDEGERPAVGDWVLVHMGFALSSLSVDEAADALAMLDAIGAQREMGYGVAPVGGQEGSR